MASSAWRVGVLFSETGVTSAVEKTQKYATLLAIEEINKKGGVRNRKLEPICYDPESTPKKYGIYSEQLFSQDRVRVIFGCYMSSTRKAALPVVEAHKGLLFYPTLYEGFEYSKHCIFTGAAPNQNSVPLVSYLTENYGNRIFLVGSNYVYPYESNRIITELVDQVGGKIVNECYVPLDVTKEDFAPIIKSLKKMNPDAIYSSVVGEGIAMFYEAYREAGLDPTKMPIGSQSTTEAEIAQMAPGTATGHITSAPYFESLNTPRNQTFVAAYRARFGDSVPLSHCAEAAYFQVYLFATALERAGSDRLSKLIPHLHGAEFDAPQGRVRINDSNNHTHLWPRVGRFNSEGYFDIVFDPGIQLAPDPYMVKHSMSDPMVHRGDRDP